MHATFSPLSSLIFAPKQNADLRYWARFPPMGERGVKTSLTLPHKKNISLNYGPIFKIKSVSETREPALNDHEDISHLPRI